MDDSGGVKGRAAGVAAGAPLERLATVPDWSSSSSGGRRRGAAGSSSSAAAMVGESGRPNCAARTAAAASPYRFATLVMRVWVSVMRCCPARSRAARPAAVLAQGDNAALSEFHSAWMASRLRCPSMGICVVVPMIWAAWAWTESSCPRLVWSVAPRVVAACEDPPVHVSGTVGLGLPGELGAGVGEWPVPRSWRARSR